MFHAVSFALIDSLNALLIGVIVALGIMLPARGRYRRIVTTLVAGDWLGVLVLAFITMVIFDGLEDLVQRALESPIFALVLIGGGVLSLILTYFSKGDGENKLITRMVEPLSTPSPKTFFLGFLLGVIQSATSLPFFAGLGYLSAGDFSVVVRYGGLLWYASLALSLPTLTAVFVGVVRSYPYSPAGRAFEYMRNRRAEMVKLGGYIVAAVLIIMGAWQLIF